MRRFSIISVLILMALASRSQTTFVTGIVTDTHGKPISLAKIDVVGKNNSTVTDDEGKFGLTLANTAKGDNVTFRVTKKGYEVYSKLTTVSTLPLPIKLKSLTIYPSSSSSNKRSADSFAAPIIAPNAQIVTQNQSGGTNTVINENDSFEIKLKKLKATPPSFSLNLIINEQKDLVLQVTLLNEVPIIIKTYITRLDNVPIHHDYIVTGRPTVYYNRGRPHSFTLEHLNDGQFPKDTVFRVRLTFTFVSTYYEEMEIPGLAGTVTADVELDPVNRLVKQLPRN